MGNRLAQVRAERGWSKSRLVREIRTAAARQRKAQLPNDESIKRRIAAWENQGSDVGDFYRDLLCEATLTLEESPERVLSVDADARASTRAAAARAGWLGQSRRA